ncbi:MAG TPA: tetratricopeptide repeat protein [Symbiobacteriaceae bacterium]|nr:tetratricopeptide repeat protein [Symbiobacteriaceae bacterium]
MDHNSMILERIRRGQYLQARRIAEAVLAMETSGPADKAAAAQLGAECAYQLDDMQATISLARQAIVLAEGAGSMEVCGRAQFRLSGALIAAGETQQGVEAARQFIAGLADRWPDLEGELAAKAYANLAMAQRNMRRFPDALQAYWQALARFQNAGHVEGEINTRIQMAYLLLLMEETDEAAEHLERSGALLSPDVPGNLAVHQLTHEALLRLNQARYTEAVELAQEVLAPGRHDVTTASRAVALYVAGMASLRCGSPPTARMFLGMAQESALQCGLAHVMNLVHRLAVELHTDSKVD